MIAGLKILTICQDKETKEFLYTLETLNIYFEKIPSNNSKDIRAILNFIKPFFSKTKYNPVDICGIYLPDGSRVWEEPIPDFCLMKPKNAYAVA